MVSVIIPNYNHSAFLSRRINSVLNQTYRDFEVIILDDCSTDNSREIIDTFKSHDKISKIVYNEINSGSVFKQWEKGIDLAKGEFIWIAESDDSADHNLLEILTKRISSDAALGFVYADSVIIENGVNANKRFSQFRNDLFNTTKWSTDYIAEGHSEIDDCLWRSCTVNNASAVLFRKEALLKANPFDAQFRYMGDWYCYLKMCNLFKIGYINEPLNYYNEHDNNASIKLRKGLSYVLEYFMLYSWMWKNLPFLDKKKLKKQYVSYLSHSLFRSWTREKLRVYSKMMKINPVLFVSTLGGITAAIIKARFGKSAKIAGG
jgi:glycosyltransferase involved in cell wall biosynthesis